MLAFAVVNWIAVGLLAVIAVGVALVAAALRMAGSGSSPTPQEVDAALWAGNIDEALVLAAQLRGTDSTEGNE